MVVVGSGAAGISVALTAAGSGLRVLMVTKDLVGGATPLAQGGLAAALGAGDTSAAHVSDTLVAGAGLSEPEVVAALADGAPGAIEWLTRLGARLETRDLRLEGGHSARRIVHSGNDATGAEVHRVLLAALLTSRIEILDRTVALDLVLTDAEEADVACRATGITKAPWVVGPGGTDGAGIGTGARARNGTAAANADPAGPLAGELIPARPVEAPGAVDGRGPAANWRAGEALGERGVSGERGVTGERGVSGLLAGIIGADGGLTPGVIYARAVVIAAGGLGQAFGTTSNPAGATGDGIAIAARAGVVIRDLEFVQFHPTVLWLPGASGQCPLITEALRGAGAVLRDLDGTPLMAGHDPRGDLAPRDIVAARMAEAIAAGDAGHVWLDATGLGRDLLEDGFPTVTAACRKHGIDPVATMIPVAPGAHYSCGGIRADLDGRSSLPGLYAAGEAASTGVQGANRLASNSVTEAIIAGRRAGAAIASALSRADPTSAGDMPLAGGQLPPSADWHTRPVNSGFGVHKSTSNGHGAYETNTFRPWVARGASANEPPASRDRGDVADRRGLAQAMSRCAGVMRDADGLAQLLRVIAETGDASGSIAQLAPLEALESANEPDLEAVEAANLRVVSMLIAVGARRRAESRGCHRRSDATATEAAPWHTLTRWDGHRLVVTRESVATAETAVAVPVMPPETIKEALCLLGPWV